MKRKAVHESGKRFSAVINHYGDEVLEVVGLASGRKESPMGPEVCLEIHPSAEGCYISARIEGTADRRPRTFAGAFGSRDEAVSEAMGWALGWLRRLGTARREITMRARGRSVR